MQLTYLHPTYPCVMDSVSTLSAICAWVCYLNESYLNSAREDGIGFSPFRLSPIKNLKVLHSDSWCQCMSVLRSLIGHSCAHRAHVCIVVYRGHIFSSIASYYTIHVTYKYYMYMYVPLFILILV